MSAVKKRNTDVEFRCLHFSLPFYYITLNLALFFLNLFTPFSNISINCYTTSTVTRQRPTQSDSGLKALYCSSRLLYVQKRWPAKTFLVGGDTEPQIDCFLDRNFLTVQSITTTKYMLLPLQKRTWEMWYSQSKDQLLFDLSAQFSR